MAGVPLNKGIKEWAASGGEELMEIYIYSSVRKMHGQRKARSKGELRVELYNKRSAMDLLRVSLQCLSLCS